MSHIQYDDESAPLIEHPEMKGEFSKMTNSKAVRGIFSLNSNVSNNFQDTSNNWTFDNKTTLSNWIIELSKASFIYQYVKEIKKAKVNRLSAVAFILTVAAGLASGLASILLPINGDLFKTLALAFSIAALVTNAGSAILSGIISKIYKLDDLVDEYTKYIERIDNLYADFEAVNNKAPFLREDATTFINRESIRYTVLTQKAPSVDEALYLEVLDKFQQFKNKVIREAVV